MSALTPLTNDQLMNYPVLYTNEKHQDASEKYSLIRSIDIIEELKTYDWYVTSVQVSTTKDPSRKDRQVHCVRLSHIEDLLRPKENIIEVIFFNSADRTKQLELSTGVYKFSCANGLCIGETFKSFKLKHIGNLQQDLSGIIKEIAEFKPKIEQRIEDFSNLTLSDSEMKTFAKLAIPLRFESHLEVDPKSILIPQREADMKDNSLYTVLNIVQEHLTTSNSISGVNKDTGRKFTSGAITSIKKNHEINVQIWDLAEKLYSIKSLEPSLALAA